MILLLALCAEAQTLAELARRERERQARLESTRVVTNEELQSVIGAAPLATLTPAPGSPAPAASTPGTSPGTTPSPGTPATPQPAQAPPAATTGPPAPPAVSEAVQRWNQELERLRARVRQLQDEETRLQLELNDLTAQFTRPQGTNETIRRQVQTRMTETQSRLNSVRGELDQTRRALQAMEAQGPPQR
jgi:hypothetical protein